MEPYCIRVQWTLLVVKQHPILQLHGLCKSRLRSVNNYTSIVHQTLTSTKNAFPCFTQKCGSMWSKEMYCHNQKKCAHIKKNIQIKEEKRKFNHVRTWIVKWLRWVWRWLSMSWMKPLRRHGVSRRLWRICSCVFDENGAWKLVSISW